MIIRRATSADAGLLSEIGTSTFVETFGHLYRPADLQRFLEESRSPASYAALLADSQYGLFLLASDATGKRRDREPSVGGYAVAGPCKLPIENLAPRAGELQQLYLRRDQQRGGQGTQLMETALEFLESQTYSPLYIGVWSQNVGAQRFYARFGFVKVGEYDFPVGEQLDREFILERRSRSP